MIRIDPQSILKKKLIYSKYILYKQCVLYLSIDPLFLKLTVCSVISICSLPNGLDKIFLTSVSSTVEEFILLDVGVVVEDGHICC